MRWRDGVERHRTVRKPRDRRSVSKQHKTQRKALTKNTAFACIALYAFAIPIGAQQSSRSKSEIDRAAAQSLPNQPLGDLFFSCNHGQLVSSRIPPMRKLGIAYTIPEVSFAKSKHVPLPTSAYVSLVAAGSIAEVSGIRTGDFILRIGDKALATGCDLADAVAHIEKGSNVAFELWRDDANITVQVQF